MKKQKQLLLLSLVMSLSLQGCALVKDEIEREPTEDELENTHEISSFSIPIAMLTLGAMGDPESKKDEDELDETSLEDELEEPTLLRKTASIVTFGLVSETSEDENGYEDDIDEDEPSLLHKMTFGMLGDDGSLWDEEEDESEYTLDDRNILQKTISTVTFGKILPPPEEELPDVVSEEEPLNKFQYGISSYDEVVEKFGEPPYQKIFADGRREARFTVREKSLLKYLPLIGELAGHDKQTVLFRFDAAGILEPAEKQEIDFDFLDEE